MNFRAILSHLIARTLEPPRERMWRKADHFLVPPGTVLTFSGPARKTVVIEVGEL